MLSYFRAIQTDWKLVVRLHNANATDKLNKQCSRAEYNVIVIPSFENFDRYICVFVCVYVTITMHSGNYYCLFAYHMHRICSIRCRSRLVAADNSIAELNKILAAQNSSRAKLLLLL